MDAPSDDTSNHNGTLNRKGRPAVLSGMLKRRISSPTGLHKWKKTLSLQSIVPNNEQRRRSAPAACLTTASSSPPCTVPQLQKQPQQPFKSSMSVSSLTESLELASLKPTLRHNHVSFDRVCIRKHARTLGDNPSVTCGPALAIGWEHDPQTISISLEEFEEHRGPRKCGDSLKLSARERRRMLQYTWHVPLAELLQAEQETYEVQTKLSRRNSSSSKHMDRTQEIMESAWRKCKRIVKKKSKQREQEWLWIRAQDYDLSLSSLEPPTTRTSAKSDIDDGKIKTHRVVTSTDSTKESSSLLDDNEDEYTYYVIDYGEEEDDDDLDWSD